MANPIEFFKGLKKHFNIINRPNDYLCKTFLVTREVKIDIIKFDEWLHDKHGNYEVNKNLSMGQLIAEEYGISARSFIEEYL